MVLEKFTHSQRYQLSPAFDVLPVGQALGYQQMRVGRGGADATLANALSEHRSFALTLASAEAVVGEVARVVAGWCAHFAEKGVSQRNVDLIAKQIDWAFLLEQRVLAL